MTPTHITAAVALAGLIANGTWMVCNIRMENRILRRIDALKRELVTEDHCRDRCGRIIEMLSANEA